MDFADEQVLVDKASRGDGDAFEVLVSRYEKNVYSLAYRLVSDREDAMDIVQDVFLKAYQALPRFRGESKFSTWIHRVCVNASLDYLRKKRKFPAYSLDEPLSLRESSVSRDLEDESGDVEAEVEIRDLGQAVYSVLKNLEVDHRVVITLCDIQGYSYQEISDMLGLSIGTVKSRLHRARNAVRRLLPKEHFSAPAVKHDERWERG
ncbi:MAG TPA: sigma-70 family RNA polymerase sigma factor [Firmicutes bacterium]|nr:sigma-70 family RNA polymerase sigma factor [Candidatus Fermentithermobacillaceae bacterium]